jgi:hypothetical protein
MFKPFQRFLALLSLVFLLLTACGSRSAEATPTTQPQTVLTAAAQTAQAQLTILAQPTATATLPPFPTGTLTPSPTSTATPLVGFTPSPAAPGSPAGDLAEYWADITVPDGTDFKPGEAFVKTWRLHNSGTTTWTSEYNLAFLGGAQMSAPSSVPLTSSVAPGDMVDVSVNLVAPQENGTYRGYWKMRNPGGQFFDFAFYVEIDVVSGTPAARPTDDTPGTARVTGASLAVDDASPDACPHTFTFTATFTLNGPATVTYRLAAGSDTPGFVFNLPGEVSGAFDKGSHSVSFTLDITDTVDGWARFLVLAPNSVESNQLTFALTCGP